MDFNNTAIPIIDGAFYWNVYGKIPCCKFYGSKFTDLLVASESVTNYVTSQTVGCSTVTLRAAVFWSGFLITEGTL
jgi:hypothetical protein